MHKSVLATLVALLVAPATALSADHTTTLDAAKRVFTWDSKAGTGAFEFQTCAGATSTCDTTLVTVAEPGTLVASIVADPTLADANLRIWDTKANGEPTGVIAEATGLTANEKLAVPVEEPGRYLIETTHEAGYGVVHGTAELLLAGDEFSVAAPAKKTALDVAKPSYDWDGLAGSGAVFDCGEVAPAAQPCDEVLVHITAPGDLSVAMTDSAPTVAWNYLAIYSSNQAGTHTDEGELGSASAPNNPNQSASASGLEPGYYLIRVGWLAGVNGSYKGHVTFSPAPPEEEGAEQ
jgi:hypothetical protein